SPPATRTSRRSSRGDRSVTAVSGWTRCFRASASSTPLALSIDAMTASSTACTTTWLASASSGDIMAATVQALRKEAPPPRSPEREQLRQAIAKRAKAEQYLAKVSSALAKAEATSTEAFRTVKRARAEFEDAQLNEAH